MQFLYDTAIHVFTLGIRIASIFQSKAKKAIKGRQNWQQKLENAIQPSDHWIWMHCSSLGEFEQGRPIFDELKNQFPNYKLALSFFSPSGYEIRKNYPMADLVFYLPFDTPKNAKTLAQILQPEYLILVKYDYWFNHLKAQKNIGTKIIVVSAIFRANQFYFKHLGKWFVQQLGATIDHFFVQDISSQKLLKSVGIDQVTVSGDTRYDRVKNIANSSQELDWVKQFKADKKLCVVGSSWPKDEQLWTKYLMQNPHPDWKFILVPHETDKKHIKSLQQSLQTNHLLHSEIQENSSLQNHKIIIVDTIGLLSRIYASAELAYVGGGFKSSGVHNTLEPAVFGVPVVIGPNYEKFNEVKLLIKNHVVFSISNYAEFEKIITELTTNTAKCDQIKQRANQVFENQPASTDIILDYLEFNHKD